MHKTKFAVALGAAAAVAVAMMGTPASAGTTSTNTGAAASHGSIAAPAGVQTTFVQHLTPLPVGAYLKHMCYTDLSDDYVDGGTIDSPQNMVKQMYGSKKCKKLKVTVTPTIGYVGQVPGGGWASWGSPNDTETATPYIYYNGGGTTLNVTFSKQVSKAGLEAEPNPFEIHTISAHYGGSGGASFDISVSANGQSGAKLLGATATGAGTDKFTTIDVSSDVDFAVAQIRACMKKC